MCVCVCVCVCVYACALELHRDAAGDAHSVKRASVSSIRKYKINTGNWGRHALFIGSHRRRGVVMTSRTARVVRDVTVRDVTVVWRRSGKWVHVLRDVTTHFRKSVFEVS